MFPNVGGQKGHPMMFNNMAPPMMMGGGNPMAQMQMMPNMMQKGGGMNMNMMSQMAAMNGMKGAMPIMQQGGQTVMPQQMAQMMSGMMAPASSDNSMGNINLINNQQGPNNMQNGMIAGVNNNNNMQGAMTNNNIGTNSSNQIIITPQVSASSNSSDPHSSTTPSNGQTEINNVQQNSDQSFNNNQVNRPEMATSSSLPSINASNSFHQPTASGSSTSSTNTPPVISKNNMSQNTVTKLSVSSSVPKAAASAPTASTSEDAIQSALEQNQQMFAMLSQQNQLMKQMIAKGAPVPPGMKEQQDLLQKMYGASAPSIPPANRGSSTFVNNVNSSSLSNNPEFHPTILALDQEILKLMSAKKCHLHTKEVKSCKMCKRYKEAHGNAELKRKEREKLLQQPNLLVTSSLSSSGGGGLNCSAAVADGPLGEHLEAPGQYGTYSEYDIPPGMMRSKMFPGHPVDPGTKKFVFPTSSQELFGLPTFLKDQIVRSAYLLLMAFLCFNF